MYENATSCVHNSINVIVPIKNLMISETHIFDTDPDPDSGEDLEGNNVQWDHLLESLTSSQQTQGKSLKMKKIPQAESRSVSTANKADGKRSRGVDGFTKSCDDVHKKQSGSHRKSSGQKQRVDLEEQERGSSPVKGKYP